MRCEPPQVFDVRTSARLLALSHQSHLELRPHTGSIACPWLRRAEGEVQWHQVRLWEEGGVILVSLDTICIVSLCL